MADKPRSRMEALDRADQCGITHSQADNMYLGVEGARDGLSAKQNKCFDGGPDQGFLANLKGKLTGAFESAKAATVPLVEAGPEGLKGHYQKEGPDARSTAGILANRARQIEMGASP